jgi:aryl-alcohol dehydrogenase-like predicted oxidoreductase
VSLSVLSGEENIEPMKLGNSSLETSPLIFGGNVFGWTVDEMTSFELLDEFAANGFNCIDTADIYSAWIPGNKGGESETIIGNWLKHSGRRKEMIIATKAGYVMPGQKGNLSREHIFKSVDLSLQRLQTDYIDLYQSHIDDPETPVEETMGAYTELIKSGKVRYIGCSNFSAQRIEESLRVSKEKGLAAYCSLQPEYNLYDRENFENELRDICIKNNLGVIPFFPLAAGFLSGKYRSEADTEGKARAPRVKKYLNEKGFKILDALDHLAKEYKASPAEIALAWTLRQPGITAPIASATTLQQLRSNMRGVRLELSAEALAVLNERVAGII